MPRSGSKKKWKSSNINRQDSADNPKQFQSGSTCSKSTPVHNQKVLTEVRALFEKKFAFVRPSEGQEWKLPPAESLFSEAVVKDWDPELNHYKAELNELKCQLSDKDIQQWHQHTSFTHRSALVMSHLRNNYWVELCTQAWCKFFEIVSSYDVIKPGLAREEGACLKSVHLCEAPGAFVTSLNHYLKSSGILRHGAWNWLATTLNPYYEGNSTDAMIADDRFILQTQEHWFFGEDNTGDLMNAENLKSLKQRVEDTMGNVQLMTADGSINCQNDPAEQEVVVSQLHYCEVVTAMALLADGGSFILKMFTMFEHQTACLMYLLNCSFREVHVFKPATSKAGNSEVYVVCLGFIGQQSLEEYMPSLLSHFGPAECPNAMFPISSIPTSFLVQLRACAATFKDYQMATISENIWLYTHMSEQERHRLTKVREACRTTYVERYAIKSIRKADKICSDASKGQNIRAVGMFTKTARKRLHGTFTERQQLDHSHWLQRLNADYQQLAVATWGSEVMTQILQNNRELMPSEVASWDVVVGKRLTSIQSSSFCTAEVLDDWNLACAHAQTGCDAKEDLDKCSIYDQTIVDVMGTDLAKLQKISRSDGTINSLCLLTRKGKEDSFLQLLTKSGGWSLRNCLVTTTTADVSVTLEERRLTSEHSCHESMSKTTSSLGIPHLGDQNIIKKCSVLLQHDKVPVVYSDCGLGGKVSASSCKLSPHQLGTRLQSLVSVTLAMHALHIGGTLIIRVPEILTRFSAGLLYVIHKVFLQITLIAVVDNGTSSSVAIIAQGFVGAHPLLIQHLWKVYSSILEYQNNQETDVLTFVPQSQLCVKEFNNGLTEFSENFLKAQTSFLVQTELTAQLDNEQMEGNTPEQTR
ncbi:cap-specific mRNA (nucleoside-2'-O-)-methyltransferase 2-like [Patiria miniata]|uniref:Cap-specific mRNA (nucleoside-2'-O-)-methyltransferase 2 n=1 Tax=Patiria miniata TaxID=46514 RepID=A0A914AJQ3_PATMI|nr:cap-specific mRNA (nucleoside-2'-O-)-methyltransferase 2-like [Patiria miniata]